jgi:hypothetical protein
MGAIMIRRLVVLTLALTLGGLMYGQCSGADGEAVNAHREIHEARLLGALQAERAINAWLPAITGHLQEASADRRWFRLGLTVARELDRLDRPEEAREMLELVAQNASRAGARMRTVAQQALLRRDQAEPR